MPVFLPGKSHGQRSLAGSQRVEHDLATKQQTISLIYILMNELLQKVYGTQYYSHIHNTVLEILLPYFKKQTTLTWDDRLIGSFSNCEREAYCTGR